MAKPQPTLAGAIDETIAALDQEMRTAGVAPDVREQYISAARGYLSAWTRAHLDRAALTVTVLS